MNNSSTDTYSDFELGDWNPVEESMLQGLVHACNNRVAALSGIVQLHEAQLSSADEGMQRLSGEVEKLRMLMGLFRTALGGRATRREPARMGEALQKAAELLAYHEQFRQALIEAPEESGEVEPVLLWPGDALRFAALSYIAAGAGAGKAPIEGAISHVGDETVVTVTSHGTVEAVTTSPQFLALQTAAARAGGSALCGAGFDGQVMLTLALPGLSTTTART